MFEMPQQPRIHIRNLEDLCHYSVSSDLLVSTQSRCFQDLGDMYLFANHQGKVFVTPFRDRVANILETAGYQQVDKLLASDMQGLLTYLVSSSTYSTLTMLYSQELYLENCNTCYVFALSQRIKQPDVPSEIPHIEGTSFPVPLEFQDKAAVLQKAYFSKLSNLYEHIASYLRYTPYLLLVCDEFGRFFAIPSEDSQILDLVETQMLSSGFHPSEGLRASITTAD